VRRRNVGCPCKNEGVYLLVGLAAGDNVAVTALDGTGTPVEQTRLLTGAEFPGFVAARESASPRWVWDDTSRWYPRLLAASVRVRRCHDLRLCHVILRNSELTAHSRLARAPVGPWEGPAPVQADLPTRAALFDLEPEGSVRDVGGGSGSDELSAATPVAEREFRDQLEAVASAADPARLRLLLAAESAGALIAAEMQAAGLPWRSDLHDALLTEALGPRVPAGVKPRRLEDLATRIRTVLADPTLNLDSQQDLLRTLQRSGLEVRSTRAWELRKHSHPVVEPLLEYKKLSRLASANGWAWMDAWIVDGRFHPDYLPGGVVTGRWATRGGGAMQLPKQVRGAVVADRGWKLVVADAAQLEPRILAALAQDTAMATAGRGADLYAGIVASGVVETREQAKGAMLGAMYGATTGEGGRLMPKLARAYPRAIGLTEEAARAGERGDRITTRLGRSSPLPGADWRAAQARAYDSSASAADERLARSRARDWGRFTRNFVVQGSAAEWALCWMAEIRKALWAFGDDPPEAAPSSSAQSLFAHSPHLVFFLHDEVIVHTPTVLAGEVEDIIIRSATEAGRLLFGDFPVDFPLTVTSVDSYAEAL
jgi:DNA polymerase-1